MDKTDFGLPRVLMHRQAGFTLFEMMVVLAIMAFVAGIAFFGLKSFNQAQPVINAENEFLVNVRALSTEMSNGAGGAAGVAVRSLVIPADGGNSYTIFNSLIPAQSVNIVTLSGVTISSNYGQAGQNVLPVGICFANPALTAYSPTQPCAGDLTGSQNGSCYSGSNGFLCQNQQGAGALVSSGTYSVTFSGGGTSKTVYFEGNGMTISRVYGQ